MNTAKKMVLGTVQFGMDYGITNLSGKPTKKKVFDILSLAWEKGIRRFDTAPGYGSEKILGEFILANGLFNEVKILTKIPSTKGAANYKSSIMESIESSLNNLGCHIDVLFFHNPMDSELLFNDQIFFEKLLNKYPVSTLGVSVYEPQEVSKLSRSEFKLAFQFPFNVLDRKFEQVNMPTGKCYARSVFLQGLLASKNSLRRKVPKALCALQNDYHAKLEEYHLSPVQFALSFVIDATKIDYFLVGVNTVDQLNDILDNEVLNKEQINIVNPSSFKFDAKWLDPRKWN